MARLECWLFVAFGVFSLAGCNAVVLPTTVPHATVVAMPEAHTATALSTPPPEEDSVALSPRDVVALAQAELAEQLAVSADQVEVREVRQVIWPDASLGCPQPERVYAQVAQAGLLIRLSVEGEIYFYHSGEAQKPFLCEGMGLNPNITPKSDEFVPPPDGDID